MVQLNNYEGFVSNEYALVSIFRTLIVVVVCLVSLLFINASVALIVFFLLFNLLIFVDNYFLAPMAFKRVRIDQTGICIGRRTIGYSQIKTVSIDIAYIRRYWGFSFIEEHTGIEQHTDIYCEEMICINGNFLGFASSNCCFYIPKNKRTVELMLRYCPLFEQCFAKYTPYSFNKSRKDVLSDCFRWCFPTIALLLILCILPIGTENKIAWGIIVFSFLLSFFIHENSHYIFARCFE